MKKNIAAASCIGLAMLGVAWLAEAKLNAPPVTPSPLVYNSAAKVYQLHGQTPYAQQTLDQKMRTIQSINHHQGQLAAETPVASR